MPQRAAESRVITVSTEAPRNHVHLVVSGDIDMDARPLLGDALRQVTETVPVAVYVDLAGVTFAGSELANFLFEVRHALPPASAIALCRPAPQIRWLLQATGLTWVATVRRDVPACH